MKGPSALEDVYRPRSQAELALIKSLLIGEGIPFNVLNEGFGGLEAGPQIGLFNERIIQVPAEHAERARELIQDFTRETAEVAPTENFSFFDKVLAVAEGMARRIRGHATLPVDTGAAAAHAGGGENEGDAAMSANEQLVRERAAGATSRFELWTGFVNATRARRAAEVGVLRGGFAARLLRECPAIERYYLIDPWRHLDDWNKPANRADDAFEEIMREALARTEFAAARRVVLRGKTTEVAERIPDGELDFAYVDGDHTLRGITIDLVRLYPKVRAGGWLAGDDFSATVWQHPATFEPTLVFPFAVFFAEAVGARIYGLPFNQFLIEKAAAPGFAFVDLTGAYGDRSLRSQLLRGGP